MNRVKKMNVLALVILMLTISINGVLAVDTEGKIVADNDNMRMYSSSISMGMDFIGDRVVMDCFVSAPYSTTSISLLFILREENAAGNLVIADTWRDSGTGYDFDNGYSYSPAIEGKEYELSVRVGIYDEDGLVGYDYETISAVYD